MGYDYEELERGLKALLVDLAPILTAGESREVEEFIDAGEYGIALETLCAILVEEQKQIPARALGQIRQLGHTMGLDLSSWGEIRSG